MTDLSTPPTVRRAALTALLQASAALHRSQEPERFVVAQHNDLDETMRQLRHAWLAARWAQMLLLVQTHNRPQPGERLYAIPYTLLDPLDPVADPFVSAPSLAGALEILRARFPRSAAQITAATLLGQTGNQLVGITAMVAPVDVANEASAVA